jgi:hypothetical protein
MADKDMRAVNRAEGRLPHDASDCCRLSEVFDFAVALPVFGAEPWPAIVRALFVDEAPNSLVGRFSAADG